MKRVPGPEGVRNLLLKEGQIIFIFRHSGACRNPGPRSELLLYCPTAYIPVGVRFARNDD